MLEIEPPEKRMPAERPRVLQVNLPERSDTELFEGQGAEELLAHLISQALSTGVLSEVDAEERATREAACVRAFIGLKPRNEAEAMLAAQMLGCHNSAMECLRRAGIKDQPAYHREKNITLATKLIRAYTLAMEAMARTRAAEKPPVRVENVNVGDGGQAIVGNVST